MNREKYKEMEMILAVYRLESLQNFVNILSTLKFHNMEPEVVEDFMTTRNRLIKEQVSAKIPCPKCGAVMRLFGVNTNKANQVGGGYRSQKRCPACGFESFSKQTPREVFDNQIRITEKARRIKDASR